MKCPKCQFENPKGAKFCNECGSKWRLPAHHASKINPLSGKFCNECGHKITSVSPVQPLKKVSIDEKLAEIQRYLPEDLTQKNLGTERQDRRGTEAGHSDVLRHGGIYFAYGEAWFRTNVLHNGWGLRNPHPQSPWLWRNSQWNWLAMGLWLFLELRLLLKTLPSGHPICLGYPSSHK